MDLSFYDGKRVFVTGHTGFKGTWLCRMLVNAGAIVTGYSLGVPTTPSLFELSGLRRFLNNSVDGDVRDFDSLYNAMYTAKPEVVFHLAAQPIVRESYQHPRETFETNVMGTVNLLECVRKLCSQGIGPVSVLNVTTDKVYLNRERAEGYREDEPLDGFDPYSNSKSCSELVTHSYINSFFQGDGMPAVSTARAGNVIGGGDFAADRILPDCIRAMARKEKIVVRNPGSVRPYQHVLDPLAAYLMIAAKQAEDRACAGYYNVGPDEKDCITTAQLADTFCSWWGGTAAWVNRSESNAPHEANFLRLDCSLLKKTFGWKPVWHIEQAIAMTCRFGKVYLNSGDLLQEMDSEIEAFARDTIQRETI